MTSHGVFVPFHALSRHFLAFAMPALIPFHPLLLPFIPFHSFSLSFTQPQPRAQPPVFHYISGPLDIFHGIEFSMSWGIYRSISCPSVIQHYISLYFPGRAFSCHFVAFHAETLSYM